MNKHKKRNLSKRSSFKHDELRNRLFKNIRTNSHFFLPIKWNSIHFQTQNFKTRFSKVSITNRCVLTHNKKSFDKIFKLSRTEFLRKVRVGRISGFSKAIW